ncbi:hypothetical protein [Fimbriiglobus ruber]|uniref:PEP-CTERM protein-sorting domain-containing protein n=1 Tax=Fimbriiglobus ruber TaxID=1908690 RepID=A0A225DAK9_9BACT|nr:hypothetical protein [Fimbriiglobus ruber]OWK38003.1 hypothetical protein FRUB_07123 [Fimbriiglobus ruber]
MRRWFGVAAAGIVWVAGPDARAQTPDKPGVGSNLLDLMLTGNQTTPANKKTFWITASPAERATAVAEFVATGSHPLTAGWVHLETRKNDFSNPANAPPMFFGPNGGNPVAFGGVRPSGAGGGGGPGSGGSGGGGSGSSPSSSSGTSSAASQTPTSSSATAQPAASTTGTPALGLGSLATTPPANTLTSNNPSTTTTGTGTGSTGSTGAGGGSTSSGGGSPPTGGGFGGGDSGTGTPPVGTVTSPVNAPEPGTLVLAAAGCAALVGVRRLRMRGTGRHAIG